MLTAGRDHVTRALSGVTVLAIALAALTTAFATASWSEAAGSCPVTVPKREALPVFGAAGFNYGGARIRAQLYWPNGNLVAGELPGGGAFAVINPDGSIYAKVGWWHSVPGKLVVTGRRLDARAPGLRTRVPDGYGPRGFQPVGITFPTVGCWRVVGRVGRARLAFVVKVTKVRKSAA